MADPLPDDAERLEKEVETGARPVEVPPSKGRPALAKVRRELTDKELASAGVMRMLTAEGTAWSERLTNCEPSVTATTKLRSNVPFSNSA